MSTRSKITLAASVALTIGCVWGVHYMQESEKAAMHRGVIRDEERTRIKREREADFAMQAELEKQYLAIQRVSDKEGPPATDGKGVGKN